MPRLGLGPCSGLSCHDKRVHALESKFSDVTCKPLCIQEISVDNLQGSKAATPMNANATLLSDCQVHPSGIMDVSLSPDYCNFQRSAVYLFTLPELWLLFDVADKALKQRKRDHVVRIRPLLEGSRRDPKVPTNSILKTQAHGFSISRDHVTIEQAKPRHMPIHTVEL